MSLLAVPTQAQDAKDAKAKIGVAGELAMRCCLDGYCFPPCLPGAWRPCRCGQWIGAIGYQPGGYSAGGAVVCYVCAKEGKRDERHTKPF